MNVVMASQDLQEYYVASVRKGVDGYSTVGKKVLSSGKVVSVHKVKFEKLVDASRLARKLAKTKAKRKGYISVSLDTLPKSVAEKMEVSPDMQMSEQEMAEYVRRMRGEKYVVFKDVYGLEDRFDLGVEYLAYETTDPAVLEVYDIKGEFYSCMYYRFESVRATEDALELEGMAHG